MFLGRKNMKILKIKADGLPLYKEPFEVSFYALQRVQNKNSVYNLFNNIYINTAEAFIGINASGKSTALNVITFCNLLLNAAPLNNEFIPDILESNVNTFFDIYFYENNKIYHLKTELVKFKQADGKDTIEIVSEKLWDKDVTYKINKNNLLNFTDEDLKRVRDNKDEYLPADVSIMIAINKQATEPRVFIDLGAFTNFNFFMPGLDTVQPEIATLLDHTIEYIRIEKVNNKSLAKLKFYGKDEIVLYNPGELNKYLSSGTIKGIRVFTEVERALKYGGYILVDEIENHFNRELVAILIRLFTDKRINPKGAVIIFSTHYPELLDELDRNDCIFITRNSGNLQVDNLNTLLKRNDIKKSEVYQSNYLGGTAPKYDAIKALKKRIIRNQEA